MRIALSGLPTANETYIFHRGTVNIVYNNEEKKRNDVQEVLLPAAHSLNKEL